MLAWLKNFEPAWLEGVRTAALGLVASLGIVLAPGVENEIALWTGSASIVLTTLQALLTRHRVYSPGTVATMTGGDT